MAKDVANEHKYKTNIEKLNKKIDQYIQKFKSYEEKHKSEVVNAYVTMRSMEGAQRAI